MTNGGGYPHEDEKPIKLDEKTSPAEKPQAETPIASKD